MNPVFFMFLLVLIPFGAAMVVWIPMHLALFTACYIIYEQSDQSAPILLHKFDPFFLIGTYYKLVEYWHANMADMPLFSHTLPLIVLPAVTLAIALYLCFRFLSFMKEHFEQ